MPDMRVVVPHALGSEEALRRVHAYLDRLAVEHAQRIQSADQQWDGNTGRFRLNLMGFPVAAVVTVGEGDVRLEGTMPWTLSLFRSSIEDTIRREVGAVLK